MFGVAVLLTSEEHVLVFRAWCVPLASRHASILVAQASVIGALREEVNRLTAILEDEGPVPVRAVSSSKAYMAAVAAATSAREERDAAVAASAASTAEVATLCAALEAAEARAASAADSARIAKVFEELTALRARAVEVEPNHPIAGLYEFTGTHLGNGGRE